MIGLHLALCDSKWPRREYNKSFISGGALDLRDPHSIFTGCVLRGRSGSATPPGSAPSGLTYPSPQTYTVSQAITPLSPTVTGMVTSYSVSPPLPGGLTLSTTGRHHQWHPDSSDIRG